MNKDARDLAVRLFESIVNADNKIDALYEVFADIDTLFPGNGFSNFIKRRDILAEIEKLIREEGVGSSSSFEHYDGSEDRGIEEDWDRRHTSSSNKNYVQNDTTERLLALIANKQAKG